MASVYIARDDVLDRHVAVKVLHNHFAVDEQFVQRFEREATAVASLNCPASTTAVTEETTPFSELVERVALTATIGLTA